MAIQELAENKNLSIVLLCETAEVSRAAYYKWLKREPSVGEKYGVPGTHTIQTLF